MSLSCFLPAASFSTCNHIISSDSCDSKSSLKSESKTILLTHFRLSNPHYMGCTKQKSVFDRTFTSSCPCTRSHKGLFCPLIHSIVSNDSCNRQPRPWLGTGLSETSLSTYVQRHIFAWPGPHIGRVQVNFHVQSVALEWAAKASSAMAASAGCTRNAVGSSAWQRTLITDVHGARKLQAPWMAAYRGKSKSDLTSWRW